MKGLLNEVTRLQKLAGILTEAKMDIPRTDRSKSDMIDYEDLGDGKVNIQMPNGEEVIVDKNAMTATWNGQDITKNLHTQGGQVFLKFGNDVEITDILKNLKQDKKKEDSLEEDEYNDEWTNKIVKIVRGDLTGNQGEVIGAGLKKDDNGEPYVELDIIVTTMFRNPQKRVSEDDVIVIGSLDDDGPVSDFSRNKELDEAGAKKRGKKKKNPGLWHNIRAQRERGEKPARKGSKEYNKAVKSAKEINKGK